MSCSSGCPPGSSTRFPGSTASRSTSPRSRRRRSSGSSEERLAPAVPLLQVAGHRLEEPAALIPAGARPFLEVEVTAAGGPSGAHLADPLARADPFPPLEGGRVQKVHVDVVVAGPLAVDHDVVAGAPGLVVPPLHPAATRRLQPRSARGGEVLALVGVAHSRSAYPIAVGMRAPHRKLEPVVGELGA